LKLTPNIGVYGGFPLEVEGLGFGVNSPYINLFSRDNDENLCSKTEITGYGTFYCYFEGRYEITDTD